MGQRQRTGDIKTGQYHLDNCSDNIDHITLGAILQSEFPRRKYLISGFLNKILPLEAKTLQKVANTLELFQKL